MEGLARRLPLVTGPVDPAEERRDGRIVGQCPQPAGAGGAERLAGEGVDADVAGPGGGVAHPRQALTGAQQVVTLGGEDGVLGGGGTARG